MMIVRFEIYVEDKDARFHCGEEQRLLHAMQAQGLGSIPVGCKGGGCGICRVQITQGEYETRSCHGRGWAAWDCALMSSRSKKQSFPSIGPQVS